MISIFEQNKKINKSEILNLTNNEQNNPHSTTITSTIKASSDEYRDLTEVNNTSDQNSVRTKRTYKRKAKIVDSTS